MLSFYTTSFQIILLHITMLELIKILLYVALVLVRWNIPIVNFQIFAPRIGML